MSNNNNKETRQLRVLVSGGGTGGHIFPALSIANEIKRRYPDAEILFVGAENRMEMERVPRAGYKIVGLPVMGFDRKRPWRNFKVLAKLYSSMRKARRIVRDFNPDIAIGVGGYASGPTLKAAQKAKVPTLLQEQNSYAGVTNKMLSKKARKICVAYPDMDRFFPAETIVMTGNPVRAEILDCNLTPAQAKEALGFPSDRPLVLVVGGSLGSRTINQAVQAGIPAFTQRGVSVLWQTGRNFQPDPDKVGPDNTDIKPTQFIDDMALAYRAADLVVSRAGASTISELQNLGKPAILVPSPNVAEDHQTKNALALVNQQAAVLVPDNKAVETLPDVVLEIISDPDRLQTMSDNIRKMALHDAAKKIVDNVETLVGL